MKNIGYNQFHKRPGSDLLYPELWRGCVGAWCPSIGPTGAHLVDFSGYGNHGTLTNMDPGTDWVVNGGGGYALDFDGVNDHVVSANNVGISGNPAFAIAGWFLFPSSLGKGVLGWGNSGVGLAATGFYYGLRGSGIISAEFAGNNTAWANSSVSQNLWHHITYTKDPGVIETTSKFFVDGIDLGAMHTNSSDSVPNITNAQMHIGRWANYEIAASYHISKQDDIRIYDRVLSPSEICLLYQLGRGGSYERRPRRRRVSMSVAARRFHRQLAFNP